MNRERLTRETVSSHMPYFLLSMLKPHWLLAGKALALAVLVSLLEGCTAALALPLLLVLGGGSSAVPANSPQFLQALAGGYMKLPAEWQLLSIMSSFLVLTVIKNLSLYFSNTGINKLQLLLGMAIRQRCVDSFLNLDLVSHTQSKSGELLTHTNEHAQRVEKLASFILEMVTEAFTTLVLLAFLTSLSLALTLFTILSIAAVTLILKKVIKSIQTYSRAATSAIENFSSLVTEIVNGIRVVKSFGAESRMFKHTEKALDVRYQAELSAYKRNSAVVPVTETAGIVVLLILLAAGSRSFGGSHDATLPLLLTFGLALLRLLPRVSHLNGVRSQLSLLTGSIESLNDFFARAASQPVKDGIHAYIRLRSEITFENVSFTFPSNMETTLNRISFRMEKGKTTALVGPSGGGKSTIADLLMRFQDPDEGCIKMDGVDLRDYKLTTLRQAVSMVSQDTFLFNTSVRENIAYGCPEATGSQIVDAAERAYALEFIEKLPQGFDTVLGNRGQKLSGGQRQRIAIARAILRNPDILILDEATSALDAHSERLVQKAIDVVSRDRTVLVIAHRLSTVEKANNIIVISDGEVVEQGTHETLLGTAGEYSTLYSHA
jgi:subfamily B ATP-binding cassette protein MsbA